MDLPDSSAGLAAAADPAACGSRWFLVFTKPAAEQVAVTNLQRQGYGVYFPRLSQPACVRGRWIERVAALFPRYLFVQLDPAQQSLAPVRSTLGVACVVRFGIEPAVVPAGMVEALIARADPQSGLHRWGARRPFERGSRVTVVGGVFRDLEGVFERDDGEDRVVILLQLLGASTRVRLRSGFVVPSAA
ncbi:MAG TPA: transcriptional activator RfaH [Steroidobacteraceae bacterium]|jgi:transcriptional antiterminator RfaH|nr:transcriptional activator RfaH [Steroidobacteraceae bacterium]